MLTERWRPPGSADLLDSDLQLASDKQPKSLIRICLYWENDASDLDLSVYDGQHRHIPKVAEFAGEPTLLADVQTGYGPECMTATGAQIAFPYLLQVQYSVRGATGDAIGAVHITQVDAHGATSFEMRPFVVMKSGAFVALGTVQPPHA
jgi:uncharacterized protein YfaP (DUF2135 family)